MRLSARLTIFVVALAAGLLTTVAHAETIVAQTYNGSFPASLNGTLATQDTVLEESFSLPNDSTLTAFTMSYANGGFQPNLTLYNSNGLSVATQWATPPPGAAADPTTGLTADGYLNAMNLAGGMYTLTLTDWELQQDPSATSLADGFKFNPGNGTTFSDSQGNLRTGSYALTVDVVSASSAVPEPGTFLLLAPVLVGAWLFRRRAQVRTESF